MSGETAGARCVICKTPLPEQKTGRPRIYCSQACRRAREFAIRRTNTALEHVEQWMRGYRLGWTFHTKELLPRYEAEHARLQTQLLELLGGENHDD